MQLACAATVSPFAVVSILTGPEGPMQRVRDALVYGRPLVSILTGPEGPMQLLAALSSVLLPAMFQSSPAPKGRCNTLAAGLADTTECFNPHRPRRADATRTRPRARPCRSCFNPHRPRRADATRRLWHRGSSSCCFNPHRPRRADATVWRLVMSL